MQSAECRMSAECGMRNAECAMFAKHKFGMPNFLDKLDEV